MELIKKYIDQYNEDYNLFYLATGGDGNQEKLNERIEKNEEPLLEQMTDEEIRYLSKNHAHGMGERMYYHAILKRRQEQKLSKENKVVISK
jgi:hypothetical protein